jgi:hypothetical protein
MVKEKGRWGRLESRDETIDKIRVLKKEEEVRRRVGKRMKDLDYTHHIYTGR